MTTDPPKTPEPGRWQFSLRGLLVAVAFVAVGCTALKFAGPFWWTALSPCTLLLFMTALVVALVDRGPRQAFAIGFIACMATYGLLLAMAPRAGSVNTSSRELDPYEGDFPTTKLLQPLFRVVAVSKVEDMRTGKELRNYTPMLGSGVGGLMSGGIMYVGFSESPLRRDFMLIGHLLWMLLFGYVGGQVARFVYHRRVSAHQD